MKAPQQNNLHLLLMVLLQMAVTNFIYAGPYLSISILPLAVLMMPLSWSTRRTLLTAVAAALAVDLLAEGAAGLNLAALLPTVIVRDGLLPLMTTKESMEREGHVSLQWLGTGRFVFLTAAMLLVFTAIYSIIDCAGTRPAGFILLKTAVSFAVNLLIYFPIAASLLKPERK